MDTCEYPDCKAEATCSVHAQWTVVDFLRFESCEDHAEPMLTRMAVMKVDGQRPLDLWVQYYFPW